MAFNNLGPLVSLAPGASFWWWYNMANEPNQHFEINWAWEDALAQAVQ